MLRPDRLAGLRTTLATAFVATRVQLRTLTAGVWSAWAPLSAGVSDESRAPRYDEAGRSLGVDATVTIHPLADTAARIGDQVRVDGSDAKIYAITGIRGTGLPEWTATRFVRLGAGARDGSLAEGAA